MDYKIFEYEKDFQLENGRTLPGIHIAYHTYGTLNKDKSNVVWVCHALTANSDVCDWWKGLFGEGYFFNPQEHFIVCANILGSCYGSTGPLSVNPDLGKPWYQHFPETTVKDLVKAHQLLAVHLGIEQIEVLIGGSLGGQQALEWAITAPDTIKHLVLLATNAQHSPWGIAFNESQRLAIRADRTFHAESANGGAAGLRTARSIALLSYRTYNAYGNSQQEESSAKTGDYKAASYQRYQGDKLIKRFNAYAYYGLTRTMDSHNVGRGRTSVTAALGQVRANTLVLAIAGDILFPPQEQEFLAANIAHAQYLEIPSVYGHDGFLIETEKITSAIQKFYKKSPKPLSKKVSPKQLLSF